MEPTSSKKPFATDLITQFDTILSAKEESEDNQREVHEVSHLPVLDKTSESHCFWQAL
jgi:hypothetical protein